MRNNNTIKITLEIDKKTGALREVNSELDKTSKKASQAGKQVESFTSKLKKIAIAAGGVAALSMAFSSLINIGFQYNNTMEQQLSGLVALNVATSSNISVMGEQLSMTEKYNLATIEAVQTLKNLEKINADTPHSLSETVQIYKAMYVSMKKAGASSEDMVEITKKISIAAGAASIEFNSLLAGVDGLATGTVLANSDLGRFLSGLGLTNEKLKSTDNIVRTLKESLDFRGADTMAVALSNINNQITQISGEMTSGIFQYAKDEMKSLTQAIIDNKQHVKDLVYFLSLPIGGIAILAKSASNLFETMVDGIVVSIFKLQKMWNEFVLEMQVSARDVLPEFASDFIGYDEKSIQSRINKQKELNGLIDAGTTRLKENAQENLKSLQDLAGSFYDINKPINDLLKNEDALTNKTSANPELIEKQKKEALALEKLQQKELETAQELIKTWKSFTPEKTISEQFSKAFSGELSVMEKFDKQFGLDLHKTTTESIVDGFEEAEKEVNSVTDRYAADFGQSLAQSILDGDLGGALSNVLVNAGGDAVGSFANQYVSIMSGSLGLGAVAGGVGGVAGGMAITAILSAFTSQGEKLAQLNQELNNEITNRLDKQIALAEQAGGLADSLKRTLSYFDKSRSKYGALESNNSSRLRFNIGNPIEGVSDSLADLNSSFNDVKDGAGDLGDVLLGLSTGGIYTLADQYEEYEKNKAKMSEKEAQIAKEKLQSSFLDIGGDLLTFANEIGTFSDSLKGYSDDIYKTTYKQNEIDRAVAKTNQILGGFTNGLDGLIESLALKDLDAIKKDLASADLSRQNDAIKQLENALGETFINTEEALGSINALNIGLSYLANEAEEVSNLLNQAEKNQYGAHLSWLGLLDTYNAQVDTTATALNGISSALGGITSETDTLNGVVDSFQSIINTAQGMIDEFRGGTGSSYGLREFQKAFSEAKTAQDPKSLSIAIDEMSRYSSSMTNLNNFNGNRYDMAFQQALAANQLEAWQETAELQKTDAELQLEVLKKQESHLSSISRNTNHTAISTNNLTKKDSVIGGLFTEVLSMGDEIQGIKTGEYTLLLGQESSQALGDIFDGFFGSDGSMYQEISDWIDGNQSTLDLNNDDILEAIKGIDELGRKFIDLDIDSDGVMDIRMVQDASGNTLELQLLNQSLSTQQLDIRKLIEGNYSLSSGEAASLQNLYNVSVNESQWLAAIHSTAALSKVDTANLAGIYSDLGGVKTNTQGTKEGVDSLAGERLLAGIYSSTTNTYTLLGHMNAETSRIKSALYAQNQNWASGYYGYANIGYQNGGYTGNIATSRIAGVVHGQEYVVNAQTTRALGLNEGSGGIFKEILAELRASRKENKRLHEKLYTVMNNTHSTQKQSLVLQKNRA